MLERECRWGGAGCMPVCIVPHGTRGSTATKRRQGWFSTVREGAERVHHCVREGSLSSPKVSVHYVCGFNIVAESVCRLRDILKINQTSNVPNVGSHGWCLSFLFGERLVITW